MQKGRGCVYSCAYYLLRLLLLLLTTVCHQQRSVRCRYVYRHQHGTHGTAHTVSNVFKERKGKRRPRRRDGLEHRLFCFVIAVRCWCCCSRCCPALPCSATRNKNWIDWDDGLAWGMGHGARQTGQKWRQRNNKSRVTQIRLLWCMGRLSNVRPFLIWTCRDPT